MKQITCTKYNSKGYMLEITCAKRYKRANEEIDAHGDTEYTQCKECADGKKSYKKYFKDAPDAPQTKRGKFKTVGKHTKKGESPYSSKYCKSLTPEQFKKKTQVSSERCPRQQKVSVHSQGNIGTKRGSDPEPENNIPAGKAKASVPHQMLFDLELLLKAQVGFLFSLVHEGRLDEALKKIKLINKEIESHGVAA